MLAELLGSGPLASTTGSGVPTRRRRCGRRTGPRNWLRVQRPLRQRLVRLLHGRVKPLPGEPRHHGQQQRRPDRAQDHHRPPGQTRRPLVQRIEHRLHVGKPLVRDRRPGSGRRSPPAACPRPASSDGPTAAATARSSAGSASAARSGRASARTRPPSCPCGAAGRPSTCNTATPPGHTRPSGRRAWPPGRPARAPCRTSSPTPAPARCESRDWPKSASRGLPSWSNRMLAGFRSQCSTPLPWAWTSPVATSRNSDTASSTGTGPCAIRSASEPFSRYSMM